MTENNNNGSIPMSNHSQPQATLSPRQGGATEIQASRVHLEDLRPHPRQSEYFCDLNGAKLEALIEDMRRNGLRNPIEILPDNTIVCGHQRVRAARILGWSEIDAVIIDETDPRKIETRLVEDNLSRRQLGPVGMARVYRALKAAAGDQKNSGGMGDLRDRVAKLIGNRSGRTLDRNLRLLEAPHEIQDAVEAGVLSRASADRVLSLSDTKREQVVKEIRAGGSAAKAVLRALREESDGKDSRASSAYIDLLRSLRRTIPVLTSYRGKLAGGAIDSQQAALLLDRSIRVLEKCAREERKAAKKTEANLKRVLAKHR
jgi:ParB family transcriptional regulator, chromosome partitioning protein